MKKKLILLVAMLPLLSIVSCSDDDDNKKGNKKSIVGVWEETSYWAYNTWHPWGFVSGYVHEFNSDKTYKRYSSLSNYKSNKPDNQYTGTYSFDGKMLSVNGEFNSKIVFSDDGNLMEWEKTAILKRYTGN